MSPLWRIYLYPLLRSSAVWLSFQPLLSSVRTGTSLLAGVLVVLGVLLAFGVQAALPRERFEYLRQLPLARREVVRSMHGMAMVVLLSTCVLDYVNWVLAVVPRLLVWIGWLGRSEDPWRPEWMAHFDLGTGLNLLGMPLAGYWATIALLQRRRRQSKEMLPRVQWLVLLGAVSLFALWVLALIEMISVSPDVGSWVRGLLGLLGGLAAWRLAKRALARAEIEGIDAYPEESLSWES